MYVEIEHLVAVLLKIQGFWDVTLSFAEWCLVFWRNVALLAFQKPLAHGMASHLQRLNSQWKIYSVSLLQCHPFSCTNFFCNQLVLPELFQVRSIHIHWNWLQNFSHGLCINQMQSHSHWVYSLFAIMCPMFPLGDRKSSLSLKDIWSLSVFVYNSWVSFKKNCVCVCVCVRARAHACVTLEGLCVKSIARYGICLTFSWNSVEISLVCKNYVHCRTFARDFEDSCLLNDYKILLTTKVP